MPEVSTEVRDMVGKKKNAVKVRAGKLGGRPPMTEGERMVTAQLMMRPGDLQRIKAAAARRGVPTSSELRDMLLVLLEEPGPLARGVLASIRLDLGLVSAGDDEASRRRHQAAPRGAAAARSGR
jgi:hypothetical protein